MLIFMLRFLYPATQKRWMDELGFYGPSTVFQAFRDDGRVNMKDSFRFGKNTQKGGGVLCYTLRTV